MVPCPLKDLREAGIHTDIEPGSMSPARYIKMIDPSIRIGILPGQKCYPAGCALWHGPGIVKKDPFLGHGIKIGGQDRGGTIAADPFLAKIINEDENDIGLFLIYCAS